MAMLDYNTKIMIEIQQGRQLRIVLDLTNSPGDGQKVVYGHVECLRGNQCLNNFFEIKPSVNKKGKRKKPLQVNMTKKGLIGGKKVGLTLCICFVH